MKRESIVVAMEPSSVSVEALKNASLVSQETAVSPQLHSSASRLYHRVGLKDRVKMLIENSQIKDKKALIDGMALLFNVDDSRKIPETISRKLAQWGDAGHRKRIKEKFKKRQELKNSEYLDDVSPINPFDFLRDKNDLKIVELRKNFIRHLNKAVRQRYTVKEFNSHRPLPLRKIVKDKSVPKEIEVTDGSVEDWNDPHIIAMLPLPDITTVRIKKKLEALIRAGKSKTKSEDFWSQIIEKDLYASCPRMTTLANLYKKIADKFDKGYKALEKTEEKLFTDEVENVVISQMTKIIHDDLVTNAIITKIVSHVEEELPEALMSELPAYAGKEEEFLGGIDKETAQAMSQRITNRILSEVPRNTFADAVVQFLLLKKKPKYLQKFYKHLNKKNPIANVSDDELNLLRKALPGDLNHELDYLKAGILHFITVHALQNMFTGPKKSSRQGGSRDKALTSDLRRQGDEMLNRAKKKKLKHDRDHHGARSRVPRIAKESRFAEGFKRHVLDVRVNQIIYGIDSKESGALSGRNKKCEAYMTLHRLRQLLQDEKEPKLVPYKPSGMPENIKQHIRDQSTIAIKEKGLVKRLLKKLPVDEGVTKVELLDNDPLVVAVGNAADAYMTSQAVKVGSPTAQWSTTKASASPPPVDTVAPMARKSMGELSTDKLNSSVSVRSNKRASPSNLSIDSQISVRRPPPETRKASYTMAEREEFGEEYFMDWDDEEGGESDSISVQSTKLTGPSRTDAVSKVVEKYPSKVSGVIKAVEPPNYIEWLHGTYNPEFIPSCPVRLQNVKFLRQKAAEFLEDKNDKHSWNENAINVFVPPVSVAEFEPFEPLGIPDTRFEFKDGSKIIQPWTKGFHEKCAKEQLRSRRVDSMENWIGPAFFDFPDPIEAVVNSKRQKFSGETRHFPTRKQIGPGIYAPPSTLNSNKGPRYRNLVKLTRFHRLKNDVLPPTLYDPKIPGALEHSFRQCFGAKGAIFSKSERSSGKLKPNGTGTVQFILPDSSIQKMLKKPKYGKWTVKKKKLNEIIRSDDETTVDQAAKITVEDLGKSARLTSDSTSKRQPSELKQNWAPFNSTTPRFVQETDEAGLAMPSASASKRHCKIPMRSAFINKGRRWNPVKSRQKYNIFE